MGPRLARGEQVLAEAKWCLNVAEQSGEELDGQMGELKGSLQGALNTIVSNQEEMVATFKAQVCKGVG